jgi:hypothetical protein
VAFRGPNAVTISWSTSGTSGSNDTPSPQVQYGTSSSLTGSNTSQIGTTSNYSGSTLFFHNVGLFNLASSTTYYYRTVASSCVSQSAIYSFITPPPAGNTNPINITFVADLGNNDLLNGGAASRTIAALGKIAPYTNFFVHNGDISYADDVILTFTAYETTWNTFQNNMENITANYPYMTGPGNHEVTCNQLGDSLCLGTANRNFSAYLNRFRMPGNESGGYQNLWYSFNYGLVHIIVINTETDFPNAPSGPNTTLNGGNFEGTTGQLNWLENDLINASDNRANVPWIIVTGHRPFFSSVVSVPGNCSACGSAFIPYILNYTVDLYIAGHVHWYERLYPINADGIAVANNYTDSPGFIHITNGAGGAAEGAESIVSTISASAKIVTGYGYVQLQIQNSSNAVLNFYSTNTTTAVLEDTINIVRNH